MEKENEKKENDRVDGSSPSESASDRRAEKADLPDKHAEERGESADVQPKRIAGGTSERKKKKKKSELGSSRGVETMFRTSYRVHMNLSSLADTKANIMISINGLIISILIAALSSKIDSNPYLLVPTALMLLGSLVSTVIAVLAARPRVNSSLVSLDDVRSKRSNILFFGNFSRMTEADYEAGMSELLKDPPALYQNMIRDIYGLGMVLSKKFRLLRLAYTTFMISLTVGILSYIGIFIWVVQSGGTDALF